MDLERQAAYSLGVNKGCSILVLSLVRCTLSAIGVISAYSDLG